VGKFRFRFLESATIPDVRRSVESHDPIHSVIILISGGNHINIYFLQHVKILPAKCYGQIHQRWEEFFLILPTKEGNR